MTKIEEVARAICASNGVDPDYYESDGPDGDTDRSLAWTAYIDDARAAIEAMRVPTEGMEQAGWSTMDYAGHTSAVAAYQAMITAALEETQ